MLFILTVVYFVSFVFEDLFAVDSFLSLFGYGVVGQADDDHVRSFDGFFDLHISILPRVGAEGESGLNPRLGTEFLIQLTHDGFVIG